MTATKPMFLCSDVLPRTPRGGKGFEARYQAWLAESNRLDAKRAATQCSQPGERFFGLASPNDCADGLAWIPQHMRQSAWQISDAVNLCKSDNTDMHNDSKDGL